MTRADRNGRVTHREQMIQNQKTLDLYAALAGKPRLDIGVPPAPKKRAPSEPSGVPLEKEVQKQIIDGLRMHPMIGLVERINSGTALEHNIDGTKRYISFHHVYSVAGHRFRAVDVHCTLKPSGRRFVIEVKRPGWTRPKDEREQEQAGYIEHVRDCGGYGMFACSWEQVRQELTRIAANERGISSPAARRSEAAQSVPVEREVPVSRR